MLFLAVINITIEVTYGDAICMAIKRCTCCTCLFMYQACTLSKHAHRRITLAIPSCSADKKCDRFQGEKIGPWVLGSFGIHEIRLSSLIANFMKSARFQPWNLVDFMWNLPDFMWNLPDFIMKSSRFLGKCKIFKTFINLRQCRLDKWFLSYG